MDKIKIVIRIEGGVVTDVRSTNPDVEVELFDLDDDSLDSINRKGEAFEALPYEVF